MINNFLDAIYLDLFSSDKITPNAKILIVSCLEQDTFLYVENNKSIVKKKNLDLSSNFEYNKLPEKEFDYLIFNHLFSMKSQSEIEFLFVKYKRSLKDTGIFYFINELVIHENQINLHPITFCRNMLFHLPYFQFNRVISMHECYDILRHNSFRIIDTDRKVTIDLIPTYPVDIYLISCVSF